jgi:hypothetical protein
VDFAGPKIKGDIAQGGDAGKAFGNAAGGEHGRGWRMTKAE